MFTHPAVGGVLSNTGSDADAKVPSTTESNTGRPWAVTMAPSSTPSGTMTLARSSRVGTAAGLNSCAPAANCAPRAPGQLVELRVLLEVLHLELDGQRREAVGLDLDDLVARIGANGIEQDFADAESLLSRQRSRKKRKHSAN